MTQQVITFKIGPLSVRIEGEHLVTGWAQNVFAPLKCADDPDIVFRFVDNSIHFCEENSVGDGHSYISERGMSYRGRLYDMRIRGGSPTVVELFQRDHRHICMNSLVNFDEAWKMWLSQGASLNMKLLKEFAYSIFPFVLQCLLVKRNAALIHASGFSVGGKGVLLPAWGGVGKSTIMSRTVLHGSAKFIADDHAVIDDSGQMYLHTLPIHVYVYHLDRDQEMKRRVLSSFSGANRTLWRIGKVIREQKTVRWVSPKVIFGENKLTASATIESVIVLFRGKTRKFIWENCSPDEAAIPCVGVIMSEIKNLAERIARAEAGWHRRTFFSLGDMHRSLLAIYSRAFSQAACARLMIPNEVDGDTLVNYLRTKNSLINSAFS